MCYGSKVRAEVNQQIRSKNDETNVKEERLAMGANKNKQQRLNLAHAAKSRDEIASTRISCATREGILRKETNRNKLDCRTREGCQTQEAGGLQ